MTSTHAHSPPDSPSADAPPATPSLQIEANNKSSAFAGLALCLLLAVAQISLAGYQLGVGNQSIQIAFLKRLANPTLFAADPMVTQTMPLYPSYFFRLLAPLLAIMSVETLYLALQILTSFLTLAMVYALSRAIFRSHRAGLLAAALLVAGHLRALAGDSLYSTGFTHTYAALPLALAALMLAYRRRWIWAFALAGLLFNLHALTAAYALLMLAAGLLADFWDMPRNRWIATTLGAAAAVIFLASPTLALMASAHQIFDAAWINLTRIRSGDHSFPSTWWSAGNADVPRFALFFALFVLSWSFAPLPGDHGPGASHWIRIQRITLFITVALAAFFLAGYLFTDVWPWPLMIRLQPFRASRLFLILMIIHIAYAALVALRNAYRPDSAGAATSKLPRLLLALSALLTLATIAVPSFLPLLPGAVILATLAALIAGHLSWRQAILCSTALLVAFLANQQIQFPLFPQSLSALALSPAADGANLRSFGIAALFITAAFALLAAFISQRTARVAVISLIFLDGIVMSGLLFSRESRGGLSQNNLAALADWARLQTPQNAVFLTPAAGLSNFRIEAERSLVGDWRDGTQLYFSAGFAPQWLDRIRALSPGFALSDDGSHLIDPGKPLDSLDDKSLITLAKKYNAAYIILPTPSTAAKKSRTLIPVYSDDHFTAYEPRDKPAPMVATTKPAGVYDAAAWNAAETFMNTTVQQNIEKYRKADVVLTILDAAGNPVPHVAVKLDQTKQAFIFGASLGFFEPNNQRANGDEHPPQVRPVELAKLPEIFNGSMIPFSSKWQYLEPEEGQYHWSDLDKYVDYCTSRGIVMEFHHLTGILPDWVESMGGSGGQRGLNFPRPIPAVQEAFNRHSFDTVARYADRIKYFQVVNEKYMMQYVPPVFKKLQELYPNNKFGLSDCICFWDGSTRSTVAGPLAGKTTSSTGIIGALVGRPPAVETTQYKGFDAIDWLAKQGVKPDFFGAHGHHPIGLWADPRDMYNVINSFQAKGVRVHITEEYLQLNGSIVGPLRSGTWTPELQAEYLARFLTVAFSHPDVDLVNFWGLAPDGWGASNSGLIDSKGKTRPAWDTLKKLFTETWRSHVATDLSARGTLATRVFHGTYLLTLQLPSGKTATATLTIPQQPTANITLRLNPETATLELLSQDAGS